MTTETSLLPQDLRSGLGDDADLPLLDPPADPIFNDSLFMTGYDEQQRIGFYLYLGNSDERFDVKEEKIVILLPDGRLLTSNLAGPPPTSSVPANAYAAPGLRYTCVEPFSRWQIDYSGAVETHTTEESIRGLLPNGPLRPLEFQLALRMVTPAWLLGGHTHESANFRRHYQQEFEFTGSLTLGGCTVELAGSGHRNHSRGPRSFARQTRAAYSHVMFPSGRAFGLYQFDYEGQPPVRMSYTVTVGVLEDAQVEDVMELGALVPSGERLSFRFLTSSGPVTLRGTTIHAIATTKLPPRHFMLGLDREAEEGILLWATLVRFELDGEVGYGLYERMRPVDALPAATGEPAE